MNFPRILVGMAAASEITGEFLGPVGPVPGTNPRTSFGHQGYTEGNRFCNPLKTLPGVTLGYPFFGFESRSLNE
jgi:hypothetical protein